MSTDVEQTTINNEQPSTQQNDNENATTDTIEKPDINNTNTDINSEPTETPTDEHKNEELVDTQANRTTKVEFEPEPKQPQNKSKQNNSIKDKKKKKKSKKKQKKKSKDKQIVNKKNETTPPILELEQSTTDNPDHCGANEEEIKEEIQQPISLLTDIEKKLFESDNDTYNGYKTPRSQFQGLVKFPKKPEKSTQMQRLSYLLKQYQTFNNNTFPDNDLLVYRFVRDGNIEDGMCFYDVKTLLNDYYYGLVHYTNDDMMFSRLYQYVTTEMGALCDVNECEFVQRNYVSNIFSSENINKTESDDNYYAFEEVEQNARIRLLDKIHCHLCHSYDFGFILTTNEKDSIQQEEKENEDNERTEENDKKDNEDIKDYKIVNMRRIIRQKRNNLISTIGKENYENNKFVTIIGAKKKKQESMFGLGDILPNLTDDDDNYKLGQKFYYWDYYKRAGWKWFIKANFENLKEEMMGNNLVNILEWNINYNKASNMSESFLSKSYTACVEKHFGTYFYGIKESEKLSINNIISVLLFCNCSLQRELHSTYIKLDGESDEELKKRHSYYANWARILCETVEIFRNITFYKTINDFYHGTNCCMYFDEIYASLYAPTSMTKSMEVIMCYGNGDGLLLDLQYMDNNNRYFECNWVSNWIGENEILFVGSSKLYFKSIIHYSLCHNYTNYISAITKIEDMLHGNPADQIITKPIIKAVDELINYELKKDHEATIAIKNKFIDSVFAQEKIADYVFEFFHHFVSNTNYHIIMDMYMMINDYKSINKYFLNKKKTFVAFDTLCFIFRNVKYISLLPGWSLQQNCAVQLTRDNMIYLYHVLKSFVECNGDVDNIDENKQNDRKYPNIVCQLERISIENPRCDILSLRDAVEDFKEMYKEIGWEITSNKWKKGDIGTPVLTIVKNK